MNHWLLCVRKMLHKQTSEATCLISGCIFNTALFYKVVTESGGKSFANWSSVGSEDKSSGSFFDSRIKSDQWPIFYVTLYSASADVTAFVAGYCLSMLCSWTVQSS